MTSRLGIRRTALRHLTTWAGATALLAAQRPACWRRPRVRRRRQPHGVGMDLGDGAVADDGPQDSNAHDQRRDVPGPRHLCAVGAYTPPATKTHHTAWAAVLSETVWSPVTLALPTMPLPHNELACVGVVRHTELLRRGGTYASTSGIEGLVETDTKGTWVATRTPVPDTKQAILNAVDCLPTRTCTAAGVYEDPTMTTTGEVLVTGSGATWTASTVPFPANAAARTAPAATGADVVPSYVSCAAPRYCAVAVHTGPPRQHRTPAGRRDRWAVGQRAHHRHASAVWDITRRRPFVRDWQLRSGRLLQHQPTGTTTRTTQAPSSSHGHRGN